MACHCVDVAMGSYANQESVITPAGKLVGIDRCLLAEARSLWEAGIVTIESCCGHNRSRGYIAVAPGSIPAMKSMGYVVEAASRPEIFLPKATE